MSLEARIEISDGVLGSLFRPQLRHPVDRPLAQHQLHDGFTPPGQRRGRAAIVSIAAATDEGRVTLPGREPC